MKVRQRGREPPLSALLTLGLLLVGGNVSLIEFALAQTDGPVRFDGGGERAIAEGITLSADLDSPDDGVEHLGAPQPAATCHYSGQQSGAACRNQLARFSTRY